MSVSEAWRLLADTNHLNRAIGLPAVSFSPLDGAPSTFTRSAHSRAFGLIPLSWKEYPFDWVRNRSYKVRREFERGPLAVLECGIELEPAGEGVTVKAFADYTPANWTGRFLWRLGNATVTDLLAFCDRYLSRKTSGAADPVPVPARPPAVNRPRLERLTEQLRQSPLRQELVPRLRGRVLEGGDDQVVGVRPFALAEAHRLRLVPGPRAARPAPVRITYADGRWIGPHSLAVSDEEDTLTVPRGATIGLRNQTGGPLLVVLEEVEWRGDQTTAAQV